MSKIFLLEVLISPKDGSRLAGFDCSGPQRPMLKAQAEAAPGSYTPEDCLGALARRASKMIEDLGSKDVAYDEIHLYSNVYI